MKSSSYLLKLHNNLPFSICWLTTTKKDFITVSIASKEERIYIMLHNVLKEINAPELLCKTYKDLPNWHLIMVLLENSLHPSNLDVEIILQTHLLEN